QRNVNESETRRIKKRLSISDSLIRGEPKSSRADQGQRQCLPTTFGRPVVDFLSPAFREGSASLCGLILFVLINTTLAREMAKSSHSIKWPAPSNTRATLATCWLSG